jgi:hypothetical protein
MDIEIELRNAIAGHYKLRIRTVSVSPILDASLKQQLGKEMKKESIEQLRARLARDEELQTLVRRRAYEIYKTRGGRPGNPAHDWLQAENEILVHLIHRESVIIIETAAESSSPTSSDSTAAEIPVKKKGTAKPRGRKAAAQAGEGEPAPKAAKKADRPKKTSSKTTGKSKGDKKNK